MSSSNAPHQEHFLDVVVSTVELLLLYLEHQKGIQLNIDDRYEVTMDLERILETEFAMLNNE